MAWRVPFQLGRPNAMALFEINPDAIHWDDQKLEEVTRGADGTLNAVTISRDRPGLKLSGNYITPAFWNQLRGLMMVDDTPLVFSPSTLLGNQVMEVWTERAIPTALSTVPLADNSFLRGSALQVAAGGSTAITPIGVWTAPGVTGGRLGAGTNYWTAGSYADATRTLTLGTPLPSLVPVFVTYQSTVLAVHLAKVPSKSQGGWVDAWRYDLEIQGA
jgi:hypothetical protein